MTAARRLLVPNSFQMPNVYVDEVLPILTGTEVKVLLFVARKTFGWGKIVETLTIAEIMAAVNGSRSAVSAALNRLVEMVVIAREGEAGYEFRYALQLDSSRFKLGDEAGGCVESTQPPAETHPESAMTPPNSPVGGHPQTGGGTPYIQNPPVKTQEETQRAQGARFFNPDPKPKDREAAERAVAAERVAAEQGTLVAERAARLARLGTDEATQGWWHGRVFEPRRLPDVFREAVLIAPPAGTEVPALLFPSRDKAARAGVIGKREVLYRLGKKWPRAPDVLYLVESEVLAAMDGGGETEVAHGGDGGTGPGNPGAEAEAAGP